MGSHYWVCIRTRRVHFLWIINGSPVEGRLNWDVVLLSRVLGGSRALGRKFFVVPNRYHLKMAPDCLNFRRLVVVLTMSFKCLVATLNLEIYQVNLSQWLFVKFLGTNPAGLWWPTSQKATTSDTEYWIAYVRRETVLFVGSECLFSVFVTPGGGQVKWKCLNLSDFSRFAATGFSGISPWSGSGCPRLVLGWGDGRH